jgi:O-acetyl-ADP-ribose deacetylase (regulator of RNase III)
MKNSILAFPSIGCGQLGRDPKIIAEHMIGETYRQLKALQSPLIVSFVLLPEQKNVYDAFADQLSVIKSIDDTPTSISFDKQSTGIRTNFIEN